MTSGNGGEKASANTKGGGKRQPPPIFLNIPICCKLNEKLDFIKLFIWIFVNPVILKKGERTFFATLYSEDAFFRFWRCCKKFYLGRVLIFHLLSSGKDIYLLMIMG